VLYGSGQTHPPISKKSPHSNYSNPGQNPGSGCLSIRQASEAVAAILLPRWNFFASGESKKYFESQYPFISRGI
jgi:hypothetical protein